MPVGRAAWTLANLPVELHAVEGVSGDTTLGLPFGERSRETTTIRFGSVRDRGGHGPDRREAALHLADRVEEGVGRGAVVGGVGDRMACRRTPSRSMRNVAGRFSHSMWFICMATP